MVAAKQTSHQSSHSITSRMPKSCVTPIRFDPFPVARANQLHIVCQCPFPRLLKQFMPYLPVLLCMTEGYNLQITI